MRAAVVNELGGIVTVEDRPIPQPGPGEIVVRMEASGLCHTDIHAARGEWPVKPNPPFVPGHEGVGIVNAVGSQGGQFAVGDRVAIPWLGWSCGVCEYCVSGWETLCLAQKNTGYSIDGTYAEYAVAFADHVVRVPVGIDPIEAAPLTCAGVTTYKAVKVAGVRPSERIAVFGVGGLGHLAVQYAAIAGAAVVAVDVSKEKLVLAESLGARYTVDASERDPGASIRSIGGVDAAIVTAPSPSAMRAAFESLKRGGRLVFVGLPSDNVMALPIFETVLNGITVTGSIVGTRVDLAEVFELHVLGRTRVIVEERKLDEVNIAFDDVLDGRVPARVVFRFDH